MESGESANKRLDCRGVFLRQRILGSIGTPATVQAEWTTRVQTGEQSADPVRYWLLRVLLCSGSDSDLRVRSRRYHRQSAIGYYPQYPSGRHRQLDVKRAKAILLLWFLSELR